MPESSSPGAAADPLASWNEGATKNSIIEFVARVTKAGGEDYVAPEERIATFDNDGTLWSEKPYYFQFAFVIDRVKALAGKHPKWKEQQPFQGILAGDVKAALAGGERAAAELVGATHAGMTIDEFEAQVLDWAKTARHPR